MLSSFNLSLEEKNDIFSKGTVCVINIPNSWPILNVIQKFENDTVYFKMSEDLLKLNVLEGFNITFQILKGPYEYIAESKISKITTSTPCLVEAPVQYLSQFENNRKHKRYFITCHGMINLPNSDESVFCISKNISNSGVFLLTKNKLPVGGSVKLTISFPSSISNKGNVEFKASVIRCIIKENHNEYGLNISEIDDENGKELTYIANKLDENLNFFVDEYLK